MDAVKLMRFRDKVAIVTGAAQGIGETYAHRLAEEGAAVVVADISCDKGEAVAGAINANGGRAIFIATDVADELACNAMAAAAHNHFGRIDYLVNNAAIFAGMRHEPLLTVELAYFEKIMRVNFTSVLLVTRAVAPIMAAGGGGAIVNQSSTAAYSIGSAGAYYGIAKLAVNGLTHALASELGPQNIRVNSLAPGATETAALLEAIDDRMRNMLVSSLAIKRLGTTDDQAKALLFLLSDDASFITGQTLCVDGGRTRRL